jgi:cysteine synthase
MTLADGVITAHDPDAFEMTRRLAREEGVFAGSSGGAAIWATIEVAKKLGAGKRVVTVIPDSAERYLSKNIFEGP